MASGSCVVRAKTRSMSRLSLSPVFFARVLFIINALALVLLPPKRYLSVESCFGSFFLPGFDVQYCQHGG
jgi:hypothetical protein